MGVGEGCMDFGRRFGDEAILRKKLLTAKDAKKIRKGRKDEPQRKVSSFRFRVLERPELW
jgi:hypothetical protein